MGSLLKPGYLWIAVVLLHIPLKVISSSNWFSNDSEPETKIYEQYYLEGLEFYKNDSLRLAIEQFKKSIDLATKSKDLQAIAKNYYKLGRIHQKMNAPGPALDYYLKVIDFPKDSIDEVIIEKSLGRTASIYQDVGEYENALKYLLQNLDHNIKFKHPKGIAEAQYEIGRNYYHSGDYNEALKSYRESYNTLGRINGGKENINDAFSFTYLSAIGSVYEKLGKIDSSIIYNRKALQLAEKIDYKPGIPYALQNIGTNYTKIDRFREAEEALKRSIALSKSMEDEQSQVSSMVYLAQLYSKENKYEKATNILLKAHLLAVSINAKPRIEDIYTTLADVYEKMDDHAAALKYFKLATAIHDTLQIEDVPKQMALLKSRYEIEKQEDKIALLEQDKKLLEQENQILEKDKQLSTLNQNISLFVVLGLFVLISIVFYHYRKQKGLSSKIQDQKTQLEQINAELEQFAYVASHDLKEPIRTIGSFANLIERRYKDKLDQSANEYMHFIKDAVDRMQQLLSDLLAYSRIDRQKLPEEWIESREIVEITLANLNHQIKDKSARVHVNYQKLPKIKASSTQMVQLFQNIISNGLKFSKDDSPEIWIDCKSRPEEYIFSIKDNGIGIQKEFRDKIFEMFSRLNNRNDYEGTGIGLATCKKIIERHGGRIWLESEMGRGSTFYFSLPTAKIRKIREESSFLLKRSS